LFQQLDRCADEDSILYQDVTAQRSAEPLERFSASTQRIHTTRGRDVTTRRY
jgi:hypothetical protein